MIEINFKFSIIIALICGFISFFYLVSGFPGSLDPLIGQYKYEALAFPLVVIFLDVLAWFYYYKEDEGHLIAFMIGFFLLIPVVGSLVSESVNNVKFNRIELWVLAYLGVSHILYALTNWRELLKSLGEPE